MRGESPTRPAIFHARPEVVVVPEMSPFSFRARQLIVPVGGCATTSRIHSAHSVFSLAETCDGSWDATCSFHSGLQSPGAQFDAVFAFQASQATRDFSVRRFIRSKPCISAKRSAPGPTSRT